MMVAMDDPQQNFVATGRTGRRNALPDIRSEHASTSTAQLPEQLAQMSCSDESSGAVASGQASGSADSASSSPENEKPPSTGSSSS